MEQSFVAWAKMRARRLPQVKLGIGDDAAVLQGDSRDFVITADSLIDGVHFLADQVDPRRIGRKLVNANISDLAAMAAEPDSIFLSMCLPLLESGEATERFAAELYEGVCEAAEVNGVALAGGDTNCYRGPLVLHLTAIGRVVSDVVWKRSGAQPDDAIVVTGPLGGSILGKHLDFSPRTDWVRKVRGRIDIHAAMDISDGLSVDLLRMCDASQCGAILTLEQIPITSAAKELAARTAHSDDDDSQNGVQADASPKPLSPVEHALGDGEDFELLLAVAPSDLPALRELVGEDQAIQCGVFTSRTGLWSQDGGKIRQLTSSGYVHGR